MRKTKADWILAGVKVLGRDGARGLTIAALLKEVGVSKGSFYHHFDGMDGYIDSFLTYFEEEGTLNIVEICNQEPTPQQRLYKLIAVSTGYRPDVEVAMRAWALQDDRVRAVHERVDARRIAYLHEQFQEIVTDTMATQLANLFYAVLVGSDHTLPPISADQQRAMFYALLEAFGIAREMHDEPNA